MPTTRNGTSDQSRSTAPFSLAGTSKLRLAAFTVVALKSHLKHFKLSTTGIKAGLVDRLHSHLYSMEETGTNNPHVADTNDSETHAPLQGNGTSGLHVVDTSNPAQNVLAQGNGASLQVSDTSTSQWNPPSQGNPTNNPQATAVTTSISSQNVLPQQFLNQLSNIFQQATSSSVTRAQAEEPDTIEDDCLSTASQPVHSTLPVMQPPTGCTLQVNPVTSHNPHHYCSNPICHLFLPRSKKRLQEVSLSTSQPSCPNPCLGHWSPSSRLPYFSLLHWVIITSLNPQPPPPKELHHFQPGCMEAWSLYLSV